MRRWIFWILILGFVWFLIHHLTEVQKVVQTFQQGRWQWNLGIGTICFPPIEMPW